MSNYIISLALTYFKEKKENYIISELMEILGYNSEQIDSLIANLMQNEYIKYVDDLLTITCKGIIFLISNNHADLIVQTDDLKMPHIDPQKALALDQPYVPVKFTKKYKG